MPETRRHQRTGAGVRPPLGGTKALRDVLHLDFGRQPTRWAARVACIFIPNGRASQRLSGRGFRASRLRSSDAWLILGCWTLQHGRLPRMRLQLQQDSETTWKHFLICLTFDVRGGPPAGRPLDGGVRHRRCTNRDGLAVQGGRPRGNWRCYPADRRLAMQHWDCRCFGLGCPPRLQNRDSSSSRPKLRL
jgi:hypothetical protein